MNRNDYLSKIGRTINFILDYCHYHGEVKGVSGTRFSYTFIDEDTIHSIHYMASDSEPHLEVVIKYTDLLTKSDKFFTTCYYSGKRKNIEFVHEDEELLQTVYDLSIKYRIANELFEF